MSLADDIQQRFDASIIAPSENAIEKADRTLAAAARLFYAAIIERRQLMPASPDYWSSSEPGAKLDATLHKWEAMMRAVLADLGNTPTAEGEPDAAPPPPAFGSDAPAPGALVRDTRLRVAWRVIRSRQVGGGLPSAFAGEWRTLCERLSGEQAGEQEWIPASELEPHEAS